MTLDERLQNVSIIGAAGKMGSGIAVLIAGQMVELKEKNPDVLYKLNLIDVDKQGLVGLGPYMKKQLTKLAEKSINNVRALYADREDLVENTEMIENFIFEGISVCSFTTDLDAARDSNLVFEAIVENIDIKEKVLGHLKEICKDDVMYFTNTSSVPIGLLDERVGLNGKIIGYHFYNPPVIQKLVEVITNEKTDPEIKQLGDELGKRLRKKLVPANDTSGFIGNGHFAHDGLHALEEAQKLVGEGYTLPEAIYIMNVVSQKHLIRPMGVFQLIDYVGVDVFWAIFDVMSEHIPDPTLKNDILNKMMDMGVKGGQNPDGTQKDGFLQYKRSRPIGVFDMESKQYIPMEGAWKENLDSKLGPMPEGWQPWRAMLIDPGKDAKLEKYFANLRTSDTMGAKLGVKYLERSKAIGRMLVDTGIANTDKDVNDVLLNGFFHIYGPINNY
ncbi:3-hydroxyacyl-CoA dehydrogenase family protein [bacterium]|nr:3-hydroxyacyl-CoA dehydrogenase family protein [bacterium]